MKLIKATVAKLRILEGKSELIVFDEDLAGFGLRLRAGGSAAWIAQYRIGARQRRVTLGKLSKLEPNQARTEARRILAKAELGQDPQAERMERALKAAVTFKAINDLYLKHAEAKQRPRSYVETKRHLTQHWQPLHSRPVHEIDRRDIAASLRILAETSGGVASNRARSTLSAFYAWAIGHGLAEANPVIGTVRPGIERPRERVLSADEIRIVWSALGDHDHGHIARLLLLTGQRRAEVAGLYRDELDLDKAVWSLPAERTKNGLPHDVPLSIQAVALLQTLPQRHGRGLLFGEGKGPYSGWSRSKSRLDAKIARLRSEARLGRLLKASERPKLNDALPPWTLHDLRRTVVTGMNELGIQPHVVEAVVNHISGRAKAGVAGVYNRAIYATEKRMALQASADHLDKVLGLGERTVIPIRA